MAGAYWVRAALQVNPFVCQRRNSPSTMFTSEPCYNKALLDEYEELGIELIAITDHWAVNIASGSFKTRQHAASLPYLGLRPTQLKASTFSLSSRLGHWRLM